MNLLLLALLFHTTVARTAPQGAGQPFLAPARDGLVMSWLEPTTAPKVAVRFARMRNGKWSPPRNIIERDDLFVNWADFPSIVEDRDGVLYVHWLQKSAKTGYSYDIWMTTSRDDGATWRKPFVLHSDGKKVEHGFVSLAPLPSGGVGVTWLDGRNMIEGKEEGEMALRYATVDPSGKVALEAELDRRTCECCATGMTVASSGPVIVYRDRSEKEIRDIAYVHKTASGWSKPQLVSADGWEIKGCPVNGPQIDAIGNTVMTAWFTAPQGKPRVSVAVSTDGGATFGKPLRVDAGNPIGRVDVVMIDAQSALVTWIEQVKDKAEIHARRIFANRADPPMKIGETSALRDSGFPRIARVGADVYFAWTEATPKEKRLRIAKRSF